MSTFKTFMVLSVVFASVNAAGKSGKSQVFVENGSQIGCLNGAGKWVSSDSCATFDYHPNGGTISSLKTYEYTSTNWLS